MDKSPPAPLGAVALAALLWAVAAAVAASLFDDGVEPIELVEARAVITAVGLIAIPGAWRRAIEPDGTDGQVGARGKGLRTVIGLGLAIALVNACYYLAIDRLPVAVAIVLQYVGPALVVLWVALRERRMPSRPILIAVALAFSGVVLVSEVLTEDLARLDLLGVLFGFGSAITFAAYTLQSEKAQAMYGTTGALARAFLAVAVFWIAFQIPRGVPTELVEPDHLLRVLFVGVGGTLVPFVLYIWAVGHLRSERAVIAATLEPVFAAVVAWLWLEQVLGFVQIAGGILILVAVTWLQMGRRDREAVDLVYPRAMSG